MYPTLKMAAQQPIIAMTSLVHLDLPVTTAPKILAAPSVGVVCLCVRRFLNMLSAIVID